MRNLKVHRRFGWVSYAALAIALVLLICGYTVAAPIVGFGGMIMDTYNQFADGESVAATAGTALIGDVIDLGANPGDLGVGEPLYLVVRTQTEIITGGAAGTIQFKLASDAQAAIATDGSATDHMISASFVTDGTDANDAELKAGGSLLVGRLPSGTYERYLGVLAIIGTTTVTAGAIDAFLTHDINAWKAYADASN